MNAFKSPQGKAALIDYYNMLLEKSGVAVEQIHVPTRYGDTFLLAAGDAANPPLLLLHGSSMNSIIWVHDMAKYSRHFRVYAPDMPGEPGQSDETQLPFTTDDYVDWLNDLFAALAIGRAALAGISLGAWLTAKFALRHPQKVTQYALLCPAGIGSQNTAFKEIALSLLVKGEEGLHELTQLINGGQPVPEVIANYLKLIAVCFNARQEEIPIFTDDELRRLTMPGILFVGGKDILLRSEETAERMSCLVPACRVVMLPDRGHSLIGLTEDIMEFFASMSAR